MIAEHDHQLDSPDPLHPGRPTLVDVPLENDAVRFCLRCRQERRPVTFFDVIGYLAEKLIFVNRFWVHCFMRRHSAKFAVQRAKYLEKERHDVSAEDLKAYSASMTAHLTSVPSELFGMLMKLVWVLRNTYRLRI
jgi:hypothetical protein